jgi:hypothetical protein
MPKNLFTQNVIAIVWDFDKTLIPGYMQEPLFRRFKVDAKQFWEEVEFLPQFYRERGTEVSRDTLYLNHILTYVEAGYFEGLTNAMLREMGREIVFYAGIPEFFRVVKERIERDPRFAPLEITVEHYIVSTGLRQIILGSAVSKFVEGVWGCEFIEEVAQPGCVNGTQLSLLPQGELTARRAVIKQIGYAIDNTTKTRAIFEINKGTNKNPAISVNASIREEDRRVPFHNMIYIADGPSDIPVFSIVNKNGGRTYAVYKKGSSAEFAQVNQLQKQRRIEAFGEANYTEDSQTYMWILNAAQEIAERIVRDHERAVGDKVHRPPIHLKEP